MERVSAWLRSWGALALARPGALLATFALGGACAFVYSYVPLHASQARQVAELSERLAGQDARAEQLAHELAQANTQVRAREDVAAVEEASKRAGEAERTTKQLRGELDRTKKHADSLERERDQLGKQVAKLEKKLAKLAKAEEASRVAAAAARRAPEASPARDTPPAAVAPEFADDPDPAAPAVARAGAQPPAEGAIIDAPPGAFEAVLRGDAADPAEARGESR